MRRTAEHLPVPLVHSAVPLNELHGDDDLDTKLLRAMAEEAIRYVRSFPWCIELHETYFSDGVGGVVALFLSCVTIRQAETPEWIWVIVGDLPSAYMEFEPSHSPRAALLRYIEGVEEWLAASEEERPSANLIPIDVPPGTEFIDMPQGRIETLRSLVLPNLLDS
jgi:hypothetical protein